MGRRGTNEQEAPEGAVERKDRSPRLCVEESLSLLWDSLCQVNGNREDPKLKSSSSQVFAARGMPCICIARVLAQNFSCECRREAQISHSEKRLLID